LEKKSLDREVKREDPIQYPRIREKIGVSGGRNVQEFAKKGDS